MEKTPVRLAFKRETLKANKHNCEIGIDESESQAVIMALKERIKELVNENQTLKLTLKRSREINKNLLLTLHEQGMIKQENSIFSLFKDVALFK